MSLNISFLQIQEGNGEDPGRKVLSLAILSQKGMNVSVALHVEKEERQLKNLLFIISSEHG